MAIIVITATEGRGHVRYADLWIKIEDSGITDVQKMQIEELKELEKTTSQRRLIVCDCLALLAEKEEGTINGIIPFLSSMICPAASVVGVYNTDMAPKHTSPYWPDPLRLIDHAATTVITVGNFHHILEERRARGRSREEPVFGVEQHIQGIVQGMAANGLKGISMQVEHRRKSGNTITESYYLLIHQGITPPIKLPGGIKAMITLLDDHPLLRPEVAAQLATEEGDDLTFEMGLTDRQRHDREGVVLPYYDAQSGLSDGGRILYDMGAEDDFDDEEDEI